MKVQYTKAEIHDAVLIFELFQQLKHDGHEVTFSEVAGPDAVADWLNDDSIRVYVARINRQIIGVLRAIRGSGWEHHSCNLTIAVSSDYRRQGIGKALILYGLSHLKNLDITIARANVFSDNRASVNTFLSAGFTITGSILKHHYSVQQRSFVDDILMSRELI